ncbi:MAG: NADH-quinone oxidoreductase subunit C [Bacteroidales bacterium]|nr:NADH-quinone oxidoreductase subunit C [Bacteroidales bacterium]
MQKQEITDFLKIQFPDCEVRDNTQLPELVVPLEALYQVASQLKEHPQLELDYLISMTAVDWKEKMTLVYHLDSSKFRHVMVLKADVADRENPMADTVSSIWQTSEYHEREVFDLFGIRFNGHPDLRRLFLEDDYGYPLRKDFTDEVNIKKM